MDFWYTTNELNAQLVYIDPVGEKNSLYPGEFDWISGDYVFVLLHDVEVTTWAVLNYVTESGSVSL